MPNSFTESGGGVFNGCTSLKRVNLSEDIDQIPFLKAGGHSSFEFSEETYFGYFQGCSALEEINIPDTITEIPDTLKTIGDSAFQDCTSLRSIKPSENLSSLGAFAFYNCTSLESIYLPDSLTNVGAEHSMAVQL